MQMTSTGAVDPEGFAASASASAGGLLMGWLANAAISGAAGYVVGKHTGSPVGTAVASAIFGLPGMLIATIVAPKKGVWS